MVDDQTLPTPEPVAVVADSPAPQSATPAAVATPAAQPSQLPPPESVPVVNTPAAPGALLPSPEPVATTEPIEPKTHGILDSLNKQILDPLAKMIAGPGTMLGMDVNAWSAKNSPNAVAEPWREKLKTQKNEFLDSSLIIPSNAFTPEEKAAHPHLAAASQGVSDAIKGLTTPGSIAFIAATAGTGEIPAILEKTLGKVALTAPYAAKAAKLSKAALQGMGVYFTSDQIARVLESVPEVAQAVMTGQTDKAIGLATSAAVNGVVAGVAGRETWKSIHGSVDAARENSAMAHPEYSDIVKDRQKMLQVAGGQKNQVATLGRDAAPDVKDREWATEYVEAGKDRDLMKQRQAQTAAGPTPSEQIEAHAQAPKERIPVQVKSDGPAWAREFSAHNDTGDEIGKVGYDTTRDGTARMYGSFVREASRGKGVGQELYINAFEDAKKAGLKTFTSDPTNTKPDAMRVWDKLKDKGYPIDEITHPNGKPGFSLDLSKLDDAGKPIGVPVAPVAPQAAPPTPEERQEAMSPEELASPAAQHALKLQAAIKDAQEEAKAHVITPEERAEMVEQQDPTRKLSAKHEKAIDAVTQNLDMIKKEAQKRGMLPQGQVRDNFVPHEYDFDDSSDPTKARLYDSYHDAQQAGLVGKNKDFYALASDYMSKMWNRIADFDTVNKMKKGVTREGAPLAVSGGFVEGQRVSTEGPQSHVLGEDEVKKYTKNGQLPRMIKSGRVVPSEDGKSFTMNTKDYIKADNLFENRPIGPTPIPPKVLNEMRTNGSLDALLKKGLVYEGTGADGKPTFFNKENLYARVPVYLHPDIAEHFNDVVKPKSEAPTTRFGRLGKLYDDATGNMKSWLLSFSPFHKVTESMRMMESLGIVQGGKLALQTNLHLAPKVDYFNLTPVQESAIRDGIVVSDPHGRSSSNVEEGLSAGSGNTFGAEKAYQLLDKGLEKIGVPANIRNKINLQKILTEDVFGPQGMITAAKFKLYEARKPGIAEQIKADHPDWSSQEVDKHAGEIAARFANNKFGGLNHVLMGRAMGDQTVLRRLLLAPDFLESTGRSILDLGDKYGSDMVANLIKFNIAHLLTTAGINYALHHKDEDNSVKGAVNASHVLDHPFNVVGADGKTTYGVRSTVEDFLHMINKRREFAYNRVSPLIRSAEEIMEQRNQYGRKESLGEAVKSLPKATLPIQLQNAVGLGPNTTTEPSTMDQFMKSIGIQAKPNRTNAEQLAIDKVSAHLQGQEARTGTALVRQQAKFNAEDNLRSAYAMKDPEKRKAAIDAAKHDIQNLAYRKIIDAEEVKKLNVDAQGSRLKSIFNSLTPDDALDVWDVAKDDERKELDVAMNTKYLRWRENLAKHGQNINSLNADDQEILNRFQAASAQAAEIKNRPEPAPVKKQQTAEKTSAPAKGGKEELPEPEAAAVEDELPPPIPAPVAPEIYKTGDFTPIINDAAKKYDVDPGLVSAIIKQESAGNPGAVSNKNAHGLMQLEPITARQYGVTDINDPIQNIDAGTHYIADLLKRYDGDEAKALAAYNAGPDAVDKYNGVPPYKETEGYVKNIQKRKP